MCRTHELISVLYSKQLRPQIEYCTQFWAPNFKHNVEPLGTVQGAAKIISGLET